MSKRFFNETNLLQKVQAKGLVVDKLIFDCEAHFCETVHTLGPNKAAYIAYCSRSAVFLWVTTGHCRFRYQGLDEKSATKKDLIALLYCLEAVDEFDEDDEDE